MISFEKSKYCSETSKHKKLREAGQYLLRVALGVDTYEQAEFVKGEYGKPYIAGHPIHFNISHSGRYVVLVTADCEVGVDIQERRTVNAVSLAKRFFTREEQAVITGCTDAQDEDAMKSADAASGARDWFYYIWCRKEAYGKCLGVGLNEQVLHTNVLHEVRDYKFHDLDIIPGYQISICSRKGEYIEKIIDIFEGL